MYEKKIGNSSAEAIGRIPQTKNDIFPDRNLVDREVGVVAAMKMKTSVTNQWVAKQLSLVNVLKISCMANVSIKESDPEFIEKLNATTNHKPRPLFSLMDAENRLIVMETHPAVAEKRRLEFAYDSQGRRIRKEVQEWEPGSGQFVPAKSLRFFYDGWNLIEERDLLNGDAVKRRHVWGLDVTGTPQGAGGVGGLLWSETATHTFAASADANSNIIAWVETATLSVSGRADYGAFGEPVMRTGAAREMPFGFSTKYTDFETDLLYYGYRYYSPSMGRWLNRDPIEEQGGLHLYGFVGSAPVNEWDYLGLSWKDIPRGMWMEVVERYLRPRGYRVAEHLFVHSLQDNPADLFFPRTHYTSQEIKGSQEFQDFVDRIVDDTPAGYHELSTKPAFSTIQFNRSRDLFLGIHWAGIEYEGVICKVTNSTYFLELTATIKDDYDFRLLISEYRRSFTSTVANNMAWTDQV